MKNKKPNNHSSISRDIPSPTSITTVVTSDPVNAYDYYIDYHSEDPISVSADFKTDDQLSAVFERLLLDGHAISLPVQTNGKVYIGKSKDLADYSLDGVLRVVVLNCSNTDPEKKKIEVVAHGGPKQPHEINFYLTPYPNAVNVFLINFTINFGPWSPPAGRPI